MKKAPVAVIEAGKPLTRCPAAACRCAAHAEKYRDPWASGAAIDAVCEQILPSTGNIDEAYARYALTANRAGTYRVELLLAPSSSPA